MKMKKLQGVRTIRSGCVKFFGKVYVPNDRHCEYNGELDGTRWFFICHRPPHSKDILTMWGDEQRYMASCKGEDAYDKDCERREANINETGQICWSFWKLKEEE